MTHLHMTTVGYQWLASTVGGTRGAWSWLVYMQSKSTEVCIINLALYQLSYQMHGCCSI